MIDAPRELVFGYGSLAAGAEGLVAALRGGRRGWGVAMDNRRDLPGYKFYTDVHGRRPEVFVCFGDLALTDDPAQAVTGLCRPVTPAQLPELDARERNYVRVDVSDRVDVDGARVWTYIGSDDGRARFAAANEAGTAVICGEYLRTVHAAFRALGATAYGACVASLRTGTIPVVELRRHELP